MEREIRVCVTCNKGDHTGKDCPTRPGCFTPDYVNWEPIGEETGKDTDFTIEAFTFANGYFVVTVTNKLSGRSEIVEVTPADIMGILKK